MKRYLILFIVIYVFCGNLFPQNTYNKMLNFNRSENHLLVSLTPVNGDYLIVCGTHTNIDNNRKRSSLVAKIDSGGNIINHNYVIDSIYDVYEGNIAINNFYITTNNTYKYVFDGHNQKFILFDNNKDSKRSPK